MQTPRQPAAQQTPTPPESPPKRPLIPESLRDRPDVRDLQDGAKCSREVYELVTGDDASWELIDGTLRYRIEMPDEDHGRVCAYVKKVINAWDNAAGYLGEQSDDRDHPINATNVFIPDVGYSSYAHIATYRGKVPWAAQLVVEVNVTRPLRDTQAKCQRWIAAGARTVWLIDCGPAGARRHTVYEYSAAGGAAAAAGAVVAGGPVVTSFQLPAGAPVPPGGVGPFLSFDPVAAGILTAASATGEAGLGPPLGAAALAQLQPIVVDLSWVRYYTP